MHVLGPRERDASLADFSHEVGHSCVHCQAIREIGPADSTNPICRLMASAKGRTTTEVAPRRDKKALRNEARRARKAGKRHLALALAIRAA